MLPLARRFGGTLSMYKTKTGTKVDKNGCNSILVENGVN